MKINGIIFDLDGVIVHTDKLHYLAWKSVADKLGIDFNEKINNKLRGVSRMESLEIILENSSERLSETEKQIIADEKNNIYRKLLGGLNERDVSDEVKSTLGELKELGYKLAIGSSSKNADFILKQIKLQDIFDAVSDGNNISKSKPDPEVFVKAAEFIMLKPENCVVVEDARSGVDAAVAGGFRCAGIGDAARYDKATWKIGDFKEIKGCILIA